MGSNVTKVLAIGAAVVFGPEILAALGPEAAAGESVLTGFETADMLAGPAGTSLATSLATGEAGGVGGGLIANALEPAATTPGGSVADAFGGSGAAETGAVQGNAASTAANSVETPSVTQDLAKQTLDAGVPGTGPVAQPTYGLDTATGAVQNAVTPTTSSLMDKAITWAQANPKLAAAALQGAGLGLSGIAQGAGNVLATERKAVLDTQQKEALMRYYRDFIQSGSQGGVGVGNVVRPISVASPTVQTPGIVNRTLGSA